MDTCLTERRWLDIAPRPFTADGGQYGQVTIVSTLDFRVKQIVRIKSDVKDTKLFEVKRVLSLTQLVVGPGGNIQNRSDITEFLTADNAIIFAANQPRASIPYQQHENAVYAEEPIIAKRIIQVDQLGCYYDKDNPFPVDIALGSDLDVSDIITSWETKEITVTAGTPVEVKTGASARVDRKLVKITPKTGKLKYGHSATVLPFQLFKNQDASFAFGPLTTLFIDALNGSVTVAIAEGS